MGDIRSVFLSFSDFLQHNLAVFMVPLLHNVSTRRGWRVHPDADVNTIQGGCFFFFPESFSSPAKRFLGQTKAISQNGGTPKWLVL